MSSLEEAVADLRSYAADNRHGYELASRDYDLGTDCSGLILRLVAKLKGVDPEELAAQYPDWSTRTMRRHMVDMGLFDDLPFDEGDMRFGDVLLKEIPGKLGHTVVVSGARRIIGAEGNWDGRHGDGNGGEIVERSYYENGYNHILRFKGDEVTEKDMQRIADLAAEAVWNKVLNDVKARDRLIGIDNAANGANNEVHRKDDPTGRGKEMTTHDHVKWIGAIQQDIIGKLDDIKAGVDAIGVLASKSE